MPKVSEEYFENKRNEIIDAAIKIALTKSLSSMTLKDVRDEIGMARGGMYRYFNNLDEILGEVIIKANQETSYIDEVEKILVDKKATSKKPATVIKNLCEFFSEYTTTLTPEYAQLSIQFDIFIIHEPERVMKIMEYIQERNVNSASFLANALLNYIKAETKKGTIKPVMPAEKLVEYFFTIYEGILLKYCITLKIVHADSFDIESSFTALYHTIVSLLGCK